MSRVIWKSGTANQMLEHDASETLHQIGRALDEMARDKNVRGTSGLLDAMLAHWHMNQCDLSLTMNSISGEDILESAFSFQPDHVQVFVNTEAAYPEDVKVVIQAGEGGFDLSVLHKDTRTDKNDCLCAQRHVQRSYRFVRTLAWDKAEYVLLGDGILQVYVPGPRLAIHPLPFNLMQNSDRAFPQQDPFFG